MVELFRFESSVKKYLFSHKGRIYCLEDNSKINCDTSLCSVPTNQVYNGMSVPIEVQIQFTNRCNLACPHCYVSSGNPLSTEMTNQQIKDLLSALQVWGVLQIEWSGGEVFTRKNFLEFVRFAHDLGFEQKLLTNGIAIGKNKNLSIELWRYFFSIQISMDSFGENFNRWVGKQKMWDDLQQALGYLWSSKPEWARLSVTTTLDRSNINDLSDIAECLRGRVSNWKLARQVFNGRSNITDQTANDVLFQSWPVINELRTTRNDLVILHPFDKSETNGYSWPVEWHTEIGARLFMYVGANGDCYPFPYFDGVTELFGGNVLIDPLDAIWSSDAFCNFRNVRRENTGCTGCQKICRMWARAFSYFNNNNLYEQPIIHPGCPHSVLS